MKQTSTIIVLGIIQMIILTLIGLYFYRLKHQASEPHSFLFLTPSAKVYMEKV